MANKKLLARIDTICSASSSVQLTAQDLLERAKDEIQDDQILNLVELALTRVIDKAHVEYAEYMDLKNKAS